MAGADDRLNASRMLHQPGQHYALGGDSMLLGQLLHQGGGGMDRRGRILRCGAAKPAFAE